MQYYNIINNNVNLCAYRRHNNSYYLDFRKINYYHGAVYIMIYGTILVAMLNSYSLEMYYLVEYYLHNIV